MERVQTNTHSHRDYIEYHMHKRMSLSASCPEFRATIRFALNCIQPTLNATRADFYLMLDTEPFDILNYFDLSKENTHRIIVTESFSERILLLFAIYVYPFVATDRAHFIENIIRRFLSLSPLYYNEALVFFEKCVIKIFGLVLFYLWCQFNVIHISNFYQMEAIVGVSWNF